MSSLINLNEITFEEEVINNKGIVIVDFWAEWCGPCRMIAPYIEQMATEFEGKAVIGKVDIEQNNGIATKFGIRNIPTILYFKNGMMVDKHVGMTTKDVLSNKLTALL